MYNKRDIVKILNEFNYFIDEITLSSFIKNWKIDAMYEDEDGVEFFDNLAIAKLKKGISLKSQGYANDQITFHVKKLLEEKTPAEEKQKEIIEKSVSSAAELQNLTIDVTGQTLQMLADAVAAKITSGIKEQIQNSEFVTQLLEDGSLKQDNENLVKQVEELTEDNKKLAKRVEELEKNKRISAINFEFFKKFFN
jgi:CRISPR/Cas system-associated endoribonuclease Cas2